MRLEGKDELPGPQVSAAEKSFEIFLGSAPFLIQGNRDNGVLWGLYRGDIIGVV